MAMTDQSKRENFFEGNAWVLFLVIGLLEILFGWGDMIAGVENDPAILISITGRTPAELKAQDPVFYAAMDHQQKLHFEAQSLELQNRQVHNSDSFY